MENQIIEMIVEAIEKTVQQTDYAETLFSLTNEEDIPSGIFHWSDFDPYRIAEFDGNKSQGICNQSTWQEIYTELYAGQKREDTLDSPDNIEKKLSTYHENGQVPIAISHYTYQTLTRTGLGRVLAADSENLSVSISELLAEEQIIETKTTFMASAILPDTIQEFEILPHIHYGMAVNFVVPRELFLTNIPQEAEELEIDFDDGQGYSTISFNQVVTVEYTDEFSKQIRLRIRSGQATFGAIFRFTVQRPPCVPDATWNLEARTEGNADTARGTAWVFYGKGRKYLEEPIILADGFGKGATKLATLWNVYSIESDVDQGNLVCQLQDKGKDVILLGYGKKEERVQKNAQVAIECIKRAIKERKGQKGLVVGGISMGGIVTRYALSLMEYRGENHETTKYISYDTPHQGAWVPLILQYLVYEFEKRITYLRQLGDLLRSDAAKQLLWVWPGPEPKREVKPHKLRTDLYNDLKRFGWMKKCKKYAVANGRADGVGNGSTPGEISIRIKYLIAVYIQPKSQEKAYIGRLANKRYYVKDVPAFDSAPGGVEPFFKGLAEALKKVYVKVDVKDGAGGNTCFVPTVSALSIDKMHEPNTCIDKSKHESPFDDYIVSTNTKHVEVTEEIARWITEQIASR